MLAALVGGAVFALGWLLLGTAARAKKDREIAARVAAVTGAAHAAARVSQASEGTQGWIPDRVTNFGRRFAELPWASATGWMPSWSRPGSSVRSGEFVVLSVVAFLVGGVIGAALMRARSWRC